MQQKQLALRWGTRVVTHNGRSGRVRGAFLAPRSNRISHLLVRSGLLRTATLPFDKATQEPDGTFILRPLGREGAAAPQPRRGSIHFSPKNLVRCVEAPSLPLQGFLLDPKDHAVTSLLAGSPGDPKVIAIDRIHNLGSGSPSAMGIQMLELPSYRPDEEAQARAERALRNADPTDGTTYGAVQLKVYDGTAYMTGNVRLPIQRAEAERAVRRAAGVIDIQSDILTDGEVEIAIAEDAARVGLTRSGILFIKCSLGRVTLTGSLASEEQVRQATSLAGATDGVLEVATDIGIVEPPPAVEPPPEPEGGSEGQESVAEKGEEEPAEEEQA